MHIHKLPDDVLHGILQHSCYFQYPDFYKWKRLLLLLSICKRWRHLAIPLVYNRVYLSYYDQSEDTSIVDDEPVETIKGAKTKTNLDLFVINNCASLARYADIRILFTSNAFKGLNQTIERMKSVLKTWSGIKTLSLTLVNDVYFVEHQVTAELYDAAQINQLTKELYNLIPGILNLRLKGSRLDRTNKHLYGKLAGYYNNQLKQLSSRHAIGLSDNIYFAQISKLDILLNSENGYKLSQMCTTSLVHLNIRGVPVNYRWASFKTNNDVEQIVFPHLKTFNISYLSSTPSVDRTGTELYNNGRLKIHFPVLTKLHLWSPLGHCELLASAIFPEKMDTFDVLGSSKTMQVLSNMRIPQVKKLYLNVASTTSNIRHATLQLINKILENSPGSKKNKLIIHEDSIQIDPAVIEWSQLTLLHIGAQINMDIALKVIAKLPNVDELTFYNFVAENIPEEAFALKNTSGCHNKLEALNSSITKLMLGHNELGHSKDAVITVIKYLSVRLESLSLFGAQVAFDTDMSEFVNDYSHIYPNLTNVTFRLLTAKVL
ncbi:hypothetical protein COEREDRAFT_86678 [Coemansia reversa NRRL 1564]|uniref:F-box domain-containing protein n=1 Tax=Coemansia reversa (strain ATCC 12441 / NRRL 1564) TaxID=763665 RepID=A0A2G5BD38_COERN|nr:hypothetical protein COEREDRAFT_86678 [Coemansia reversa NRRL 1564]|eukprot:PIA16925.1 hypothetical protein COEREDRAFT_86678 [Coemansia reversa NRRL 1564]